MSFIKETGGQSARFLQVCLLSLITKQFLHYGVVLINLDNKVR